MEPFNTLILAATLLYASYLDLKKREVDDKVWLVPSALGIALNSIIFLNGGVEWLIRFALAVGVSWAVAFSLYFGGLYGGADAKALLTIALVQPYVFTPPQLHGLNAITVLTNGVLLSSSLPISFAIINFCRVLKGEKIFEGFESEKLHRKLAACFIGIRVKKSAGKVFWSPIEVYEGGVKRFRFKLSIDEIEGAQGDDMWITPGIPLLVFFTAGYFLNITTGDIIGALLLWLTGK